MKKYLYLLLLSAVSLCAYAQDPAYPPAPPTTQNIVAAEYFVDTDPGFGLGTAISLTPAGNISNANIIINVNGLSVGIHRLFIRTRNTEGRWSLVAVKDFLYNQDPVYAAPPVAPQQVTAVEYFIDTDPGAGNGTAIGITPAVDLNNIPAMINTNGLPAGIHRMYIRTRNNEGRWSISNVKDFSVDFNPSYAAAPPAIQNIIAAEYFIDTDPGIGQGIDILITPGTNLNDVTTAINTNGLSTGTHRLYLRTRSNEGHWSITYVKEFIVNFDPSYPITPAAPQNIIAAEYFIDTDPGPGSGNAIPVTPGMDVSNIPATINTGGLSVGTHRLYLRTKGTEGYWSITNVKEFIVSTEVGYPPAPAAPLNVVAAEYFVDTDPGAGLGTAISITPGTDVANVAVAVNTAGLSDGDHRLYIRTRNQEGHWSLTNNSAFFVGQQVASWSIAPAGGHDYGNVAVNTAATHYFKIHNTGNQPVLLNSVVFSTPGFSASYAAGSVIAVSDSLSVPVTFIPTAAGPYTAQLKIKSGTADVDSVITVVSGNGYVPGTPPVLQWVAASPYNGISGVNPAVGQTGLYTYKVLYRSANNRAPEAGYPKVNIDLTGDQDFNDLGEGSFSMVKEGSSTDYATGVVYSYTFNQPNNSNTLGYQFSARDDNGNTSNSAYKPGPVVTNEVLDLRLFANDISFSKNNPAPGEVFTVTANIRNSTAFSATNVPVKFYRDTILIGNGILPSVGAFASVTITHTLSFAADGFFPIKVWIDSSNTLGESNILNNYAIRPIIVGSPVLPGGITVTSNATLQQCPQLRVLITGSASYFGTASPTMVAGAEVTINTGSEIIHTTTDANGNYSYLLTGVTCGGNFTYTVSVTDFTFTSNTLTNTLSAPCPAPNACGTPPPPSNGGMFASISTASCSNVVGSNANVNFILKYRERDINNMWSPFDEIRNDTLRIFQDGVLIQTIGAADNSHGPGNEVTIPVSVPLNSTTPVNITGELSYTYVEYRQIPSSIYHGIRTDIVTSGGGTIHPEPNLPDLTIQDFRRTKFTSFSFKDANIKCGNAGLHVVRVYDSIPNGTVTLIHTTTVNALPGGTGLTINFSNPGMTPGTHILKIVTDEVNVVAEQQENNNVFLAEVIIPMPDLTVSSIKPSSTDLAVGSTVTFSARIRNTGKETGAFKVQFLVNNVALGTKVTLGSIAEDDSVLVSSDAYTVTNAATDCGVIVRAVADVDAEVAESNEGNNSRILSLGADLRPYQLAQEVGSATNPVVVRVNTTNQFFAAVRNIGERDVAGVTVRFMLDGNRIGGDEITQVRAGEVFAGYGSFTHTFTAPGDYVVQVEADTANAICEFSESNNAGSFHIRVVDSKQDLEVLSQFISPSSLNPAPGQNITLVGTVKNMGGKSSQASVLRFLVDDIQLGNDVPFNSLQPGRDTTVAATATYSSLITGVKVMKIVVDPTGAADEEREDNNEATRTMIVGDAPDMARSKAGAITFNPNGFRAGDSVVVSYSIRNNGSQDGTARVRFLIMDEGDAIVAMDSVPRFYLAAGATLKVSRKLLFDIEKGRVIAEIIDCSPVEFDLTNNNDTLAFSTIVNLTSNLVVNGDLDMEEGLPAQLPGWIGGKLVLGDYDLVVNGKINDFDTTHFVITNGTGRLKMVNNLAENVFPVGTSVSSHNFVKINNTGTLDHFTVGVAPYVLKNGIGGDTIGTGFVDRTWFIEEQTPGGSNATVTFYWNAGDELPAFDRDQSRTAHYVSSWQLGDIGAAIMDSIGRFRRMQTGFTSFSPFSVASGNIALPINLLAFKVSMKDKDAQLEWKSEAEVNTMQFVVLHSSDGIQFEEIGIVKANNRPGINNYGFAHANPSAGMHYYRLKMVDIDGEFTYSPIKWLRSDNRTSIRLYPNPAQRLATVTGLETGGTVRILTMDGKTMQQLRTSGSTLQLDVSRLVPGVYMLQYEHRGIKQQLSLIRQ